jgi:hypothetical protein
VRAPLGVLLVEIAHQADAVVNGFEITLRRTGVALDEAVGNAACFSGGNLKSSASGRLA